MTLDEAVGSLAAVLEDVRQCTEAANDVAEFCAIIAGTLITQTGNDDLAEPYIAAGQRLDAVVRGVARAFHDEVDEIRDILMEAR